MTAVHATARQGTLRLGGWSDARCIGGGNNAADAVQTTTCGSLLLSGAAAAAPCNSL
jgi:hypothetical protein